MNSDESVLSTQRELEEFRRQWKQEVESRKAQLDRRQTTASSASTGTQDTGQVKPGSVHPAYPGNKSVSPEEPRVEMVSQELESVKLDYNDSMQKGDPAGTAMKPRTNITAMDHYIEAVDNERQGKLAQALASYRRAFKLDPDIDVVYKRHYQTHIAPAVATGTAVKQNFATQTKQIDDDDTFHHIVPIGNEYIAPEAARKDPLEDLIQEFRSQPLEYIPALDYKPVLIANLPGEIIVHILQYLVLSSVSSIANFALVCKNFFLLTRTPSLWRFACEHAFKAPHMTLEESREHQAKHVQIYGGHWMRMFIERPRIRYDGVYISTCHYIRPGSSENTYNQPVHLVTYYRYLRFFPDGTILKYLSTDEPTQVVKQLTPEFDRRQVFRGHFELHEGRIYIEMKDRMRPRELFRMSLEIKSTHRGRHNKLRWIEYNSVTEGREDDEHTFDLRMMKPYFFSVVRSYQSGHTLSSTSSSS